MRRRLLKLRKTFLAVADRDTAFDPKIWDRKRGLSQHCGPVSYMVQKVLGGIIVGGRMGSEAHLWNRLPCGEEIDLTSDQYGGDGICPLKRGKPIKTRRSVNPRFALFEQRLEN